MCTGDRRVVVVVRGLVTVEEWSEVVRFELPDCSDFPSVTIISMLDAVVFTGLLSFLLLLAAVVVTEWFPLCLVSAGLLSFPFSADTETVVSVTGVLLISVVSAVKAVV